MLNPEAQAQLDRILAIDPAARTEAENAFMAARRSYLADAQQEQYGLNGETTPHEAGENSESEETATEPPKNASRKNNSKQS
jgi:hypothetical protein